MRTSVFVVPLIVLIGAVGWLSGIGRAGPMPTDRELAEQVLADWDTQRAQAWTQGDTAALARLYVAGSGAGRRDVAHLRAWSQRGWVVRGLARRVLQLEVHSVAADRVRVRVRDQMVGAIAYRSKGEAGQITRRLPDGTVQDRDLEFQKTASGWQVSQASSVVLEPK